MAEYKVVEKFVSINGEAMKAGELAVFIRFAGCNLNCSYCDTRWANTPNVSYETMTEKQILDYVISTKVNNVTLTGGEPLYRDNMELLIDLLLQEKGRRVEIETNGSVDISKYAAMNPRPSITMDYKVGSSGMEKYMNCNNFEYLNKQDTVKFVVGSREDLNTTKKVIEKYELTEKTNVYISPVFNNIEPAEIVNYMVDNNMNGVKLQLQLHKFIWDPNMKGV